MSEETVPETEDPSAGPRVESAPDTGSGGEDGQGAADRKRGTGESPHLQVDGLFKTFGGLVAVDRVSFDVAEGSMTGLIGPNGAGKTTTFNCLTGTYRPDGGRVVFDGEDITGLRPNEIANHGLIRTFQIARELQEMTVLENMMLALQNQLGESVTYSLVPGLRDRVRRQETDMRDRVWETLEFFEIDHLAGENAGNLSGGQRKLLEIARALMADPGMVLLDEPFAGVNPSLEKKILERLQDLLDEGLTFLLVEHDIDLIMNHCDRVIVMHQGDVLTEGSPDAVRNDEQVIEAYLGG